MWKTNDVTEMKNAINTLMVDEICLFQGILSGLSKQWDISLQNTLTALQKRNMVYIYVASHFIPNNVSWHIEISLYQRM